MNKKKNQGGFTLIELLIVIGLLGGLVSLVLPRLTADREEAMGDICDYNQAGTVRVLNKYNDLFGSFPADMHNGLDGAASGAAAIAGLPEAQSTNMADAGTIVALTAGEATSLSKAGVTSICSGTGLNSTSVAEDVYVSRCTSSWLDDSPAAYTFDGINISNWESATGTPSWDTSAGRVIVLWIAPTIDWTSAQGDGGNSDWTKGAVEYGISLEGKCPIPTTGIGGDPEFSYYMAYFKVYEDGSAARLLGTSCPECGVMNP